MNTTLSHTTTHPPDTEDQQVLRLPAPEELRALAFADRLSFRIGLWLLERAQRPVRRRSRNHAPARTLFLDAQHLSARETSTILAYHLQRQMH